MIFDNKSRNLQPLGWETEKIYRRNIGKSTFLRNNIESIWNSHFLIFRILANFNIRLYSMFNLLLTGKCILSQPLGDLNSKNKRNKYLVLLLVVKKYLVYLIPSKSCQKVWTTLISDLPKDQSKEWQAWKNWDIIGLNLILNEQRTVFTISYSIYQFYKKLSIKTQPILVSYCIENFGNLYVFFTYWWMIFFMNVGCDIKVMAFSWFILVIRRFTFIEPQSEIYWKIYS